MSQPDQDTRVIEPDAETYNATLVAREDIGEDRAGEILEIRDRVATGVAAP